MTKLNEYEIKFKRSNFYHRDNDPINDLSKDQSEKI